MPKPATLNRFPLFGLFAHQATKRIGYAENDARVLGYTTSLPYAFFKAKAHAKNETAEKKKTLGNHVVCHERSGQK